MSMSLTRTGAMALLTLAIVTPAAQAIEATGHDAVTTPGRPVDVEGKFERRALGFLWRPDVRGKAATIDVLGARHAARTDRDGVARATVTPTRVGVYPIEARVEGERDAARGRLFVLDPARPVVVVDIDLTISDQKEWLVPFAGHKARTFPGAPELLRDLAVTHQVLYLTARDDTFDGKTRAFLARHRFPDGPVLYNDLGLGTKAERAMLNNANHGRYKLEVLRALKARGLNLTRGIGNTETDAFAYEGAGLASDILTTQASATGTGASFRFATYADLRAKLVADGVLVTGLASAIP